MGDLREGLPPSTSTSANGLETKKEHPTFDSCRVNQSSMSTIDPPESAQHERIDDATRPKSDSQSHSKPAETSSKLARTSITPEIQSNKPSETPRSSSQRDLSIGSNIATPARSNGTVSSTPSRQFSQHRRSSLDVMPLSDEIKSRPHLFINSLSVPLSDSTIPHLMRMCSPERIDVERSPYSSGYYLSFSHDEHGLKKLTRVYKKFNNKMLFNKYMIRMEFRPNGSFRDPTPTLRASTGSSNESNTSTGMAQCTAPSFGNTPSTASRVGSETPVTTPAAPLTTTQTQPQFSRAESGGEGSRIEASGTTITRDVYQESVSVAPPTPAQTASMMTTGDSSRNLSPSDQHTLARESEVGRSDREVSDTVAGRSYFEGTNASGRENGDVDSGEFTPTQDPKARTTEENPRNVNGGSGQRYPVTWREMIGTTLLASANKPMTTKEISDYIGNTFGNRSLGNVSAIISRNPADFSKQPSPQPGRARYKLSADAVRRYSMFNASGAIAADVQRMNPATHAKTIRKSATPVRRTSEPKSSGNTESAREIPISAEANRKGRARDVSTALKHEKTSSTTLGGNSPVPQFDPYRRRRTKSPPVTTRPEYANMFIKRHKVWYEQNRPEIVKGDEDAPDWEDLMDESGPVTVGGTAYSVGDFVKLPLPSQPLFAEIPNIPHIMTIARIERIVLRDDGPGHAVLVNWFLTEEAAKEFKCTNLRYWKPDGEHVKNTYVPSNLRNVVSAQVFAEKMHFIREGFEINASQHIEYDSEKKRLTLEEADATQFCFVYCRGFPRPDELHWYRGDGVDKSAVGKEILERLEEGWAASGESLDIGQFGYLIVPLKVLGPPPIDRAATESAKRLHSALLHYVWRGARSESSGSQWKTPAATATIRKHDDDSARQDTRVLSPNPASAHLETSSEDTHDREGKDPKSNAASVSKDAEATGNGVQDVQKDAAQWMENLLAHEKSEENSPKKRKRDAELPLSESFYKRARNGTEGA